MIGIYKRNLSSSPEGTQYDKVACKTTHTHNYKVFFINKKNPPGLLKITIVRGTIGNKSKGYVQIARDERDYAKCLLLEGMSLFKHFTLLS